MKPPARTRLAQPTPQELLDSLMEFLRVKFYDGHGVAFMKDRKRLLKWVVLWPASWLSNRGVTLPADRYGHLFRKIIIEAVAHGDTSNIKYLPAWLRMVVQSHFKHHGDAIYEEGKELRGLVERTMLLAGQKRQEPDAVGQLAEARKLVTLVKAKKIAPKTPQKEQLSLL